MDTATTTTVEATSTDIADLTAILPGDLVKPIETMRYSRLRRVASPILAIIEFYRYVTSPGLNDTEPLSCLHMRDGGQQRY